MAWRRLAREAMTAQLRRGGAAPLAPTRAFSATDASSLYSSSASPTPLGRSLLQNIWLRYSGPVLRAGAAEYGASAAARVALRVRPHLSGRNLFKGLGTDTALTMMLQETATAATNTTVYRQYWVTFRTCEKTSLPPCGLCSGNFSCPLDWFS